MPESVSSPCRPRWLAKSTRSCSTTPAPAVTRGPSETSVPSVKRRTRPRNPWSETIRLVPPPVTITGVPLARAAATAAMKACSSRVSANRSAGPPIPNRVKRASGVRAETVKLGISARRTCVSSVVGITLIIGEAYFVRSAFPGFPAEGLAFFAALQRHNRREWFQPRKAIFEEKLKQPMRELVGAVNSAMRSFAPDYVTDPDKAIYRIYRDTRFSKDKTPYKDHIAASFSRRGDKAGAGFYFAVSHKEVGIGGGLYMPEPEALLAIRQHLAERHEEFRKIAGARAVRQLFVEVQGEKLTRVPKGYPCDHPAADLLRLKQYLLYVEMPPDLAATPAVYTEVVKHFRAMTPFVEFLNAPLRGQRQ